ncbi:MAG: Gfo/Idh/MocA family protein, partial [Planctomycetota bacterium]
DQWIKKGYLKKHGGKAVAADSGGVADVRSTVPAAKYDLPVKLNKPFHQPHLENFFDAVRGKAKLNCPVEIGYETAVTVLKVNEAVQAGRRLDFKPEEFGA